MKTPSRHPYFLLAACCCQTALAADLQLSKLDLSQMEIGWSNPKAGKSVDGHPLKIGDKGYADGVGTHAESNFPLVLDGKAKALTAEVGVDAETGGKGSVEFIVMADGHEAYRSGIMKGGQAPHPVKVPLAGVKHLDLIVTDGGDGSEFDHADWADARIT